MEDYPEGALSNWPRGALNGCPCCGDAVSCSSAASGANTAVQQTVAGAAAPGVMEEAAVAEGPEPGRERTGVGAGSPAVARGNDTAAATSEPVAGAAARGVVEEEAVAEGPESGRESTGVGAGSPAAAAGGNGTAAAATIPSAGAATPGVMAAAVSTGAAVLGAAVLASADWLLRDTCSPEAAGPGPSSLHSVHFDACFKLNLLSHKGYVSSYTQLGLRRYFLPNTSIQQVRSDSHASQQDWCDALLELRC